MRHARILLSPEQTSLGPQPVSPQPVGPQPVGPQPMARTDVGSPKIQAFGDRTGVNKRHEEAWKRSPNVTGQGAIHLKTFHSKLSDDAIAYMDQQINEWLDAHPQYEAKFVTTMTGEWSGKLGREPHMIVQVWV